MVEGAQSIKILHFNDVYNIEEVTVGKAGAARFTTALQEYNKDKNKLVIFSGDIFSPSLISQLNEGQNMILPFNQWGIDVSCLGNHDLDFSVARMAELVDQTNCPWLMANVKYPNGNLLPRMKEYHVIEKFGHKIGFIGLASPDWPGTFSHRVTEPLQYLDFVPITKRMCKKLRSELGCTIIIALTHMRVKDEERLAEECGSEVDLMLGGHDHISLHQLCANDVLLIKSGTDFEEFSDITIRFEGTQPLNPENKFFRCPSKGFSVDVETVLIDTKFEKCAKIDAHVQNYLLKLKEQMSEVIGHSAVELETRFSKIRTQETNFSTFFSKMCLFQTGADACMINAGTFREDCLEPAGEIILEHANRLFPMFDKMVVIVVTGEILHEALENGISAYPNFDGRFPGTAGVRFTFDPQKEKGKRIDKKDIFILKWQSETKSYLEEPIDYEKEYKLVCKEFIAQGRDGYTALQNHKGYLVDEESALSTFQHYLLTFHQADLESDGKCGSPRKGMRNGRAELTQFVQDKLEFLGCDLSKIHEGRFISMQPKTEGLINVVEQPTL